MERVREWVKDHVRPARDLIWVAAGFAYDWIRYVQFGNWTMDLENREARAYRATKLYHKLEKSLSMKERRAGGGWRAALALARVLDDGSAASSCSSQELVANSVLRRFLDAERSAAPSTTAGEYVSQVVSRLQGMEAGARGGVMTSTADSLATGHLSDPESFFLSRHSVRDFSERSVAEEDIERALRLALKSPSVCNRQAWHVYHLHQREKIDEALSFQNGNKGFGHEVQDLLIITTDLRAFDEPGERFQHWIDGGMFSMALVLAFHSLGIASCCLNWSRTGSEDLLFRRTVPILPAHTVIMMLAVGYPRPEVKLCVSARRPLSEVLTRME